MPKLLYSPQNLIHNLRLPLLKILHQLDLYKIFFRLHIFKKENTNCLGVLSNNCRPKEKRHHHLTFFADFYQITAPHRKKASHKSKLFSLNLAPSLQESNVATYNPWTLNLAPSLQESNVASYNPCTLSCGTGLETLLVDVVRFDINEAKGFYLGIYLLKNWMYLLQLHEFNLLRN